MKVYAIRHKGTGRFMPAQVHRTAGGWSYWDPFAVVPNYSPACSAPRLFFTKRSAQNALTAWLQGEWQREVRHASSMFEDDSWDELVPQAPIHSRYRVDMEIVEGDLSMLGLEPRQQY